MRLQLILIGLTICLFGCSQPNSCKEEIVWQGYAGNNTEKRIVYKEDANKSLFDTVVVQYMGGCLILETGKTVPTGEWIDDTNPVGQCFVYPYAVMDLKHDAKVSRLVLESTEEENRRLRVLLAKYRNALEKAKDEIERLKHD